jgi:hypothetical protein
VLELLLLALPCVSPEHRRHNREKAGDSFLRESERDSEAARCSHQLPSTYSCHDLFVIEVLCTRGLDTHHIHGLLQLPSPNSASRKGRS